MIRRILRKLPKLASPLLRDQSVNQKLKAEQSVVQNVIQAEGHVLIIYADGEKEQFATSVIRSEYLSNILDLEKFNRWRGHNYIAETCRVIEFQLGGRSTYSETQGVVKEVRNLFDCGTPVLVLGELGVGKTTLLEKLTYAYARAAVDGGEDVPLPIFLPLNRFVDDIWECLRGSLNELGGMNLTRDQAETLVTNTNCLVMCDGLGELDPFREEGIRAIRNLIATCPQNLFVLTCRKSEYHNELEEIEKAIEIQSLGDESRLNYMVEELGRQSAERLYKRIVNDPRLEKLANNPLFFEMMLETSESGAIPLNRGQLFQEFMTGLLKREQKRSQVRACIKEKALTTLGFDMHERRQERRRERDVMLCLSDFLDEWREDIAWRDLLDALRADDLLREESGWWFYRHSAFQRYFAAVKLSKLEQCIACEYVCDKWWHPVILFLVGIVDDPNDLVATLTDMDSLFAYRAFTACDRSQIAAETVRSMAEQIVRDKLYPETALSRKVRQALIDIGGPAVQPLVRACGNWENDLLLDRVEQILVEMDEPALENVVDLLESESSATRSTAAYLLGEIGALEAVPSLVNALGDGSPKVVTEAIQALGALGDERAIEPLKDLTNLPDEERGWKGQSLSDLAQEALDWIRN
jgi:GTPase SAR1 family protein